MTVLKFSFAPQDVAPLAAVHQQSDVRIVKAGEDPLGQRIFDIIKNRRKGLSARFDYPIFKEQP
jgi:hypothetical protein